MINLYRVFFTLTALKKRHKQTAPALKFSKGFVLLELLVVISVIGLIATSVLASLKEARESARVARVVADVRQLRNSIALYISDVGQTPTQPCILSACTSMTDPMLNSLGVPGWSGPYLPAFYDLKHPWGGQISLLSGPSIQILATYVFILNDDRPGTTEADNGGRIPSRSLEKIDQILDDGNLATGLVRGNGNTFGPPLVCTIGELCILIGG